MIDFGKNYKVYLVEVDDEDRERVVSGLCGQIDISYEPNYENLVVNDMLCATKIFKTGEDVTMSITLMPDSDGNYFTIEDFSEYQGDEDDE